jgi:hypothetical protein
MNQPIQHLSGQTQSARGARGRRNFIAKDPSKGVQAFDPSWRLPKTA